jgi:hypothetical protein
MKTAFSISARRILWLWVAFVAIYGIALLTLPHRDHPFSLFLVTAFQVLLAIISFAIVRHEPILKNKFLFANFGVFFSIALFASVGRFVGRDGVLFTGVNRSAHYFDQYVGYGAYGFFLAFAIVYLAVDTLFRDFRSIQKYVLTLAIVGTFFATYFNGFLVNPDYAYETQDIRDWKDLDTARVQFQSAHPDVEPSPEDLAGMRQLHVYRNGVEVATLNDEARLARTQELAPYLAGENYQILLWKPAYLYMIFMGVLTIGFILLYFGYQYMKDPPQGAYIEKMMFLFLLSTSMEILHHASNLKSLEWSTFAEIMTAGQYATSLVLFLFVVFFALRLRFIMSVKGEFYETELDARPAGITRWRDSLDTLIVESFFNRKIVHGRLFAAQARPKPGAGN